MDVTDSTTAKCLKAPDKYQSAQEAVKELRGDLRKAKSEARRAKIRNRLNAAVKKRALRCCRGQSLQRLKG